MKALQSFLIAVSALLAEFALISGVWLKIEASAGAEAASAPTCFLIASGAAFAFVLAAAVATLLRNREAKL